MTSSTPTVPTTHTSPVPARPAPAPRSGPAPDPLASLTGPNRDAAVALTALFKQYGLESLAPAIVDFIKKGYSADTITIMLADTPEYKKRFAANEQRLKAGLPALSPAEYLATESAYRQVLKEAGTPKGFYDSPSDFTSWLAGDVSPTEIKSRVDAATDVINTADQATKDFFAKFYSKGDMIAFALDQKRAAPLVGKAFEAAKIGGAASAQGLKVDRLQAEALASQGVSKDQAQQGFSFIAGEQQNASKLAQLSGEAPLTQSDLINEVFFNNADAAEHRARLASQERGRFSGSSAVGASTLTKSKGGSL